MAPSKAIMVGLLFSWLPALLWGYVMHDDSSILLLAITTSISLILAVHLTRKYYTDSLFMLSETINKYLQSKNYKKEFSYHGPKEAMPIAHGFSSLLMYMDHQAILTSLVREIASLSNHHDSFASAAKEAISRICDLTGWYAADLYLKDLESSWGFRQEGRSFQKDLPDKILAKAKENIRVTEGVLEKKGEDFSAIKKPVWFKVTHKGNDFLEFIIPIVHNDSVAAIMIFYGFPQIDLNSGLLDVMDIVSSELSNVKEREIRELDLKETSKLMVQAGKMATVGELAASVAHELNNPLQVIQGRTEQLDIILQSDNVNQKILARVMGNIHETVERLAETVSGLRNISYNESLEGFTFAPLYKILESAIYQSKGKVSTLKGKIISPESVDESVQIQCHSSQIAQALTNLIHNAAEAIESYDSPWIKLDYETDHTFIKFKVSDCGPGIDEKVAKKIMSPYFSTKKRETNSGLGLNIAKKIAEFHGGRIYIDTDAVNTTFVLEIPVMQRPQNGEISA